MELPSIIPLASGSMLKPDEEDGPSFTEITLDVRPDDRSFMTTRF